MKIIKRTLALALVLMLICLVTAGAEEVYLDKTQRNTELFNDCVCSYEGYFSIAFPDNWHFAALSDEDTANGVLEVAADNFDNPGMKVTVCKYSPEECVELFGDTGYDAIYNKISSSLDGVYSALINNIWTVAYSMDKDDHIMYAIDFTTTDYTMYQIRFDVYDDSMIDVKNSMILSLEGL